MIMATSSRLLRTRRQLTALAIVAGCVVAFAALATEPATVASGLARQAVQADDAGNPTRAAELYLEAFGTDPRQPNFLYSAARAEMAAGKKAEAEEHFEQFLGLADAGSDRADKARAYLADLRGSRAGNREVAAERAAADGKWRDASKLYEELWQQMPSRWSALFKAGQAAQQAGDDDRAVELLRQYLRESPKTAADRPEADERLQQLTRREGGGAAADVAQPAEAGGTSGAHIAGWTLLGTGIAMLGGGAALLLYGVTEERALNQDLKLVDGFVTADISHAQAQARADSIGLHQTLGVSLAAGGLVVAGVGTWLMLREPEKRTTARPTVLPGPGWAGLSLGWRF